MSERKLHIQPSPFAVLQITLPTGEGHHCFSVACVCFCQLANAGKRQCVPSSQCKEGLVFISLKINYFKYCLEILSPLILILKQIANFYIASQFCQCALPDKHLQILRFLSMQFRKIFLNQTKTRLARFEIVHKNIFCKMSSKTRKRPAQFAFNSKLSQTFSMVLGKGKFLQTNTPRLKSLLYSPTGVCKFSWPESSSGHFTILKKLK